MQKQRSERQVNQPSNHRDQAKSGVQELVRKLILNVVF